jgi:hypothetical protein
MLRASPSLFPSASGRPALIGLALSLLVCACAAGSDDGTGTTSGGGVAWTTSSGSGGAAAQGGNGGEASTSSGGGEGGLGSGGAPEGGAAQGGSAEGGASPGQLVMIATGSNSALAGSFAEGSGWDTETLAAAPSFGPAITLRAKNDGVALVRDGDAGQLTFSSFDGSGWSDLTQLGPTVTTRATPSLAAGAVTVSAVFHGDDFKHYFAAYASSWSPTNEQVGAPQAFGPSPAAIVAVGNDVLIAYTGNDGDLYDQTRSGGSWLAPHGHALGNSVEGTPTIVALDQGPELLVVFQRKPSDALSFATRTGGTWSSADDVPDALTNDPVALAPLAGGRAVAAFRGTNAQIYTMVFDPSDTPSWSAPAPLATPNPTTPSSPALAPGVNSADAELVYVDGSTQSVMHSRLTGSSWSAPPTLVGGTGLGSVAIASHP